MNFITLSDKNPLFIMLSTKPPKWWKALTADSDIVIEVRKGNTIDVYYKGGNIISELKFTHGKYSGKIHLKYIPSDSNRDYVPYTFDHDNLLINISEISLITDPIRDVSKIKKRIDLYNPNESEKTLQFDFIKKDPLYIDAEMQFSREMRIDLVRVDTDSKKIMFIELKLMGDRRLFTSDIVTQMEKYAKFIQDNEKAIKEYYKKIFLIKKTLKILPHGLRGLENIDDYKIATKPLLLISNCEQKWINEISPYIDSKMKNICFGCYYTGKPLCCKIHDKTTGNKHVFSNV